MRLGARAPLEGSPQGSHQKALRKNRPYKKKFLEILLRKILSRAPLEVNPQFTPDKVAKVHRKVIIKVIITLICLSRYLDQETAK